MERMREGGREGWRKEERNEGRRERRKGGREGLNMLAVTKMCNRENAEP